MTAETRKLFDAPWKAVEDKDNPFPFMHHKEIVTNNGQGHTIANDIIGDDANRLARLPELYDALQEAIFEINRLTEAWENGTEIPDYCDSCLAENKKLPHQHTMEWAMLLGKVRDGK